MNEAEIDRLRERLEEAEGIRSAITNGEVDAFVVGNDNNRRVLLLANAYQRYRQLVERMQQGAVTVTSEGYILFANQCFAEMLGASLPEIYTAPLDAYVATADRARLSAFLLVSTRDSRVDVDLVRRNGSKTRVRLALATLNEGYATVLVTDLRPLEWPPLVIDALDSMRDAVDKLRRGTPVESASREALGSISEQIDGLAALLNEIREVHGIKQADQDPAR